MFTEEEKIAKYTKSIVFVLFMLLLGSLISPDVVFVLLLSLIYLKEG
jgi:hypothetical protein